MGSYLWLNGWSGESVKANRPESGSWVLPVNRARRDGPPVSLVLLLKQPRLLDAAGLARAATAALGVEVAAGEAGSASVSGESPHFLLRWENRLFAVNNVPRPYFENTLAVAAGVGEARLRKAVAGHRAWLSVDLLHPTPGAPEDPYLTLGKLVAALSGEDCLALCVPARQRLFVYEEGVSDKLRAQNPLRALRATRRPPAATRAGGPGPRAAVAEARRRWPEFVDAFERREPGQMFSVKAPLRDGRATESLWVTVSALENGLVYGQIDGEPARPRRLKAGDRVRVPVGDLHDWLFTRGDTLSGGFTLDANARRPRLE